MLFFFVATNHAAAIKEVYDTHFENYLRIVRNSGSTGSTEC
jgi:hypothetical protein